MDPNDPRSVELAQEEMLMKKYGGLKPKKKLLNQGHGVKYFDSGDWALQKEQTKEGAGAAGGSKEGVRSRMGGPQDVPARPPVEDEKDTKGLPVEKLAPKLTPGGSASEGGHPAQHRHSNMGSPRHSSRAFEVPDESLFQSPVKELIARPFQGASSSNAALGGIYHLYSFLAGPGASLAAPERELVAITVAEGLYFEGKFPNLLSPSPAGPREQALVDFVRKLHDQKGQLQAGAAEEVVAAGFNAANVAEITALYGVFTFPVPALAPPAEEPFNLVASLTPILSPGGFSRARASSSGGGSPKASPPGSPPAAASESSKAAFDANPATRRLRQLG